MGLTCHRRAREPEQQFADDDALSPKPEPVEPIQESEELGPYDPEELGPGPNDPEARGLGPYDPEEFGPDPDDPHDDWRLGAAPTPMTRMTRKRAAQTRRRCLTPNGLPAGHAAERG